MPLCIPQVRGPVTTWTSSLLIETALPGATVLVREHQPNGQPVASGIAPSGRFRLPVTSGVQLSAGARLFAQQELAGSTSGWTSEFLAVLVGAPPNRHADTAPLSIRSRTFECGQSIWIEGAIPGAEVVVAVNGTEIGKGIAHEGVARIRLNTRLPGGAMHVQVFQRAPAGHSALSGAATVTAAPILPLPVLPGTALPQPSVGPPDPAGCDSILVVYDLIDGAELTIERLDDGSTQSVSTDLDALSVILESPLDPRGGQVAVSQSMPVRCGYDPSPFMVVDFEQHSRPDAPSIFPPCAGASHLMVDDVLPAAELSIEVDEAVYHAQVGPAVTSQYVELDPLPSGGSLAVTQSRCSLTSTPAVGSVGAAQAVSQPVVERPLYHCARVVRVTNLTPGTLVRIMSSGPAGTPQQLGNPVLARDSSMPVDVMPYLVGDQEVWAEQVGCGAAPLLSDRVRVEPTPQILPVNLTRQPFASERFVVVDALPGAFVRVYRTSDNTRELIGQGYVDPQDATIWLKRPLIERESIGATQQICAVRTEIETTFGVSPGERTFTLAKKKTWIVPSEGQGKDVIWKSGSLTCRVDGTWSFSAHLENKATKSTADVVANVKIASSDLPPFGQSLEFTLAASNNPDDPTNSVLLQMGNHPDQMKTNRGFLAEFREEDTWRAVLSATAKFDWLVAIKALPKIKVDDAKKKSQEIQNPPPSA